MMFLKERAMAEGVANEMYNIPCSVRGVRYLAISASNRIRSHYHSNTCIRDIGMRFARCIRHHDRAHPEVSK